MNDTTCHRNVEASSEFYGKAKPLITTPLSDTPFPGHKMIMSFPYSRKERTNTVSPRTVSR